MGYVFDVNKIETGKQYTYKELCQLQKWDIKSYNNVNGKKAQIKAMAGACDYHTEGVKKGMKYVIDSVKTGLDYEKIKEELKGYNLQSLIKRSILEQLKKQIIDESQGDSNAWYVTKKEFYNAIGVHSKHRDHVFRDLKRFLDNYSLEQECMNDVIDNNVRFIRDNVNKALHVLEKEYGLICKNDSYIILTKEFVYDEGEAESEGTIITEVDCRINATPGIKSFIKANVIPGVQQELEIKDLRILRYNYGLRNKFWKLVPQWINEHSKDTPRMCPELPIWLWPGFPEYTNPDTPLYTREVQLLTKCTAVYESYRINFNQEFIQKDCNLNKEDQLDLINNVFSLLGIDDNKETNIELLDELFNILEKNAKKRKSVTTTNEKYKFRDTDDYDKASSIVNRECHSSKSRYIYFRGDGYKKNKNTVRRTVRANSN